MPKLEEQVGGYLVSWEDYHVEAKVSRVQVHSDGHITGMLMLTNRNGKGDIRLMPSTQFNFSSEVTRSKLAKQLTEKYSHLECSWVEMFDYLGESIQNAALSGSPSVEVYADEDAEAPPLLIDPLIYQGHQNIIFGDKGVSKSTLCYTLAVMLARPEWDNPLCLPVNIDEPMQTMVLDWETDEPTFRWYLGRLMRGMGFGAVPVHYKRCHLPLAEDIESIAEEVGRTNVKHIIIDSLGAAAGGVELKDASAALNFNAALRKMPGITATIIGQTSKGNESGTKKTIYGSHFFTYYARNIFELYRGKDEGTKQWVGLRHTDCNFSRKHSNMAFIIEYGEKASIKISHTAYNASDFVETASAGDRIIEILKTSSKTNAEIKSELPDLSDEAIRQATKRLKDNNKIVKMGGDKWELL